MNTARNEVRRLGAGSIAFLLLVPLLAMGIVGYLAPRIVSANHQATTQVPLAVFTGTMASYEASTYAADFTNRVKSTAASQAAADAAKVPLGTAQALLTTARQGDTTEVQVTFSAPTAEQAERGLRAAVAVGIKEMLAIQSKRHSLELQAATQQRDEAAKRLGTTTATTPADKALQDSQASLVASATQTMGEAQKRVSASQVLAAAVPDVVGSMAVDTKLLSTQSDVIRMVGTAGISALLLAAVLVFGARAIAARRRNTPSEPGADRSA